VVELNGPGSMDTVNIYAGGQRIAREMWGNISFEHTNPVTGSRVTSAGHSSFRATDRNERDAFGAEIPNSNPYPSAQSYSDYNFGEQLYIEGGDPFDYSTGSEIDGIPVSEAEFQRRVEHDSVTGDVFRGGRYLGSITLSKVMFLSRIRITYDVFQPPLELDQHPELWPAYYIGNFTEEVELSGLQTTRRHNTLPLPSNLKERIAGVVNNPNGGCADFIKRLISEAEHIDGTAFSNDRMTLFQRVQDQAGFALKYIQYGGTANRKGNKRIVYINPVSRSSAPNINEHSLNAYAVTALNELMHHAKESGFYSDRTLAQSTFNCLLLRSNKRTHCRKPGTWKLTANISIPFSNYIANHQQGNSNEDCA
jgi:hypothetical protein